MADSEQLARHLRQPGAERQVVAPEGDIDDVCAVDTFGHQDGRDGVRIPLRRLSAKLHTPAVEDRGTHARGEVGVARQNVFEAFFLDHVQRFTQAVEHRQRGRVREVSGAVGLDHVAEVEKAARLRRLLTCGQCLLAGADDAQAGWQHQALLRTADAQVDAPLIHAEVDTAKRTDGVYHQQCRVVAGVERGAHGSDVGGDAGSGFVLCGEHGLDLVSLVSRQNFGVFLDRHAFAPFGVHGFSLEAQARDHVDPQVAELAEARGQHQVTWAQAVGQCGLPAAGASGRKNDRCTGGRLENGLQVRQHAVREFREFCRAMVFHGHNHGALHALWNVCRSGNKKEIATCHENSPDS